MKNKDKLAKIKVEKQTLERERQVIKALMEGEEKERHRVSRELHDVVNGNLAAMKLNLNLANNNNYDELLDQTMNEIRRLSHNLMPDVVKKFGLNVALDQYFAGFSDAYGWHVDFQFIGEASLLTDEASLHVYRIIQELINNSIKHAGANELLVQLIVNEGKLSITVEDNGKGFDIVKAKSTYDNGLGMGLNNLENRVNYLNGSFDIQSSSETGTSIYIVIPINEKQQHDTNSDN
ncbi:MAG: sensor histidine kinase [Cyclobacteriaceae bacterium]